MTNFVGQFKDEVRNSIAFPFPSEDEPIELILKLPGESCNLNCSYCYEKRQPSKSDGVIGRKTIEQLRKSIGQRPVSIGLHGGEPLLVGLKRMGELLSDLSELLNVRDIKLQTNGTKLDNKWIDLFCNSSIRPTIGISHDGPNELSAYRVDYRGLHSQSSSSHPLELLSAAGLNFGVICVISNSNVEHPAKLIEFFSRYPGLSTINFVPCFDYSVQSRALRGKSGLMIQKNNPDNKGVPGWAITPSQFYVFLKEIWECWTKTPNFIIEPFVSVIRVLSNKRPESCDFTTEKCAHVYTVYPDGKVTTCDEFESSLRDVNLNIHKSNDEWVTEDSFKSISSTARLHLEKCVSCSHKRTCGGGCIATRHRYYGSKYYEEYCSYKKNLIDFVGSKLEGN